MDTKTETKSTAKAAAPAKSEVDDKKPADKYIEYVGAATRRILTPEDWEFIGVSDGEQNVWGFHNAFKLPAGQFSDEQLDYLLKVDGRFKLV